MVDDAWKHFLIREKNAKNDIDPQANKFEPGQALAPPVIEEKKAETSKEGISEIKTADETKVVD